MTLSEYVERRNGVALGAKGSLSNNLKRAFGAGSNAEFWKHWNPVWGFYLAKYVYLPMTRITPVSVAVLVTFAVSGGLHDLALFALGYDFGGFFAIWFALMGAALVVSKGVGISYSVLAFPIRVAINLAIPALTFLAAKTLVPLVAQSLAV